MSKPRDQRMRERRLKELGVINDRMSQSDKRFFERFPQRRHRIRLAHKAEVEAGAIVNNKPISQTPPGYRHFIAVKSLAPDVRFRMGFVGTEGGETDLSEADAAELYETLKAGNPQAQKIEADFALALEKRSA